MTDVNETLDALSLVEEKTQILAKLVEAFKTDPSRAGSLLFSSSLASAG